MKKVNAEDITNFKEKIDEDYQVNWIVDNLPGLTKYVKKQA